MCSVLYWATKNRKQMEHENYKCIICGNNKWTLKGPCPKDYNYDVFVCVCKFEYRTRKEEQMSDNADLNKRLTDAGMLTIEQMMQPANHFMIHAGMTDLTFFETWLERKCEEYTRMLARYELGDKPQDDMYEWIVSHRATFHEVLINYRAAKTNDKQHVPTNKIPLGIKKPTPPPVRILKESEEPPKRNEK